MAKKGSGKHYTSKGERANVSRKTTNAVAREVDQITKLNRKLEAWSKGKRTMVTIDNPNPNETNKRKIRVEGNVAFGPWKRVELDRKRVPFSD